MGWQECKYWISRLSKASQQGGKIGSLWTAFIKSVGTLLAFWVISPLLSTKLWPSLCNLTYQTTMQRIWQLGLAWYQGPYLDTWCSHVLISEECLPLYTFSWHSSWLIVHTSKSDCSGHSRITSSYWKGENLPFWKLSSGNLLCLLHRFLSFISTPKIP